MPLESDATDKGPLGITTTPTSISYGTIGGVKAGYNSSNTGRIVVGNAGFINGNTMSEGFISFLYYLSGFSQSQNKQPFEFRNNYSAFAMLIRTSATSKLSLGYGRDQGQYLSARYGQRVHIVITGNGSGMKVYENGVQVISQTPAGNNFWKGTFSETGGYNQTIFNGRNYTAPRNGYLREMIFEKRKRSDTEVAKYSNWIRKKLGII